MALPPVRIPITADDKTKKGFKSAERGMATLAKSAAKLGAVVGATAGAAGFAALIKQQFKAQDELTKTAAKLDIQASALAGLRLAAEKFAGVSSQTLDTALQRLTRRLSEAAAGTGEARGALLELGLDANKLSSLTLEQQFDAVTKSFEGVESQADKVRLAFKLFDTEGVALVNVMNAGADAIDGAKDQVELYGSALDSVQALGVAQANDALTDAKTAVAGLGAQLSSALAPGLKDAAEGFSEFVGFLTSTALPAFKLLGERLGLIELNARSLSFKELRVRTFSLTDDIKELEAALLKLSFTDRLGNVNQPAIDKFSADLEKKKKELADVEAQIAERSKAPVLDSIAAPTRDGGSTTAAIEAEKAKNEALAKLTADREAREAQSAADKIANEEQGYKDQLARQIEAIEERNRTVIESEKFAYEQRLQILREALQNKLIEEDKAYELAESEFDKHQKRLNDIANTSQVGQKKLTSKNLSQIASVTAQANDAIFQDNKAAGIGNAIVSTAVGVAKSLELPFPLNFIQAAAVAAAGLTQISAIRSASKGGGAVPSIAGGTASSGIASTTSQAAQESQVPQVSVSFTNNAIIDDDGIYSGTQVRRLMNSFTEQIQDGETDFAQAVAGAT